MRTQEDVRQLREFLAAQLRAGADERVLRETLMREGGWSVADLDPIIAQIKEAMNQSPLVPTTPEPIGPVAGAQQEPVVPSTPARDTPQAEEPRPRPGEVTNAQPSADSRKSQSLPTTPLGSLTVAVVSLRHLVTYVGLFIVAALAGYVVYRMVATPVTTAPMENAPYDASVVPLPADEEEGVETDVRIDTNTDSSVPGATITPEAFESLVPDTNDGVVEQGATSSRAIQVRNVLVDITQAGALQPGEVFVVSWEQEGGDGQPQTLFTLRSLSEEVEYEGTGGGTFVAGQAKTNVSVPFGVPAGSYVVRVYVYPRGCVPPEFSRVILGYQPKLTQAFYELCEPGVYAYGEGTRVLEISP